MFFPEILENEATRNRLAKAILNNEFAHAYIIEGPRGCGKHTLALALAAALNCQRKNAYALPCGVCENCKRICEKDFLDVKYVKKKEGKNTIGVEDIRTMRDDVYLSPVESSYKVYIVEGADALTLQAQNALLKVFEEPPSGVVIFLLCDSVQPILSTIKSRAQFIRMQRLTNDCIEKALLADSKYVSLSKRDPEAFIAAIKLSQGCLGRAMELLSEDGHGSLSELRSLATRVLLNFVPSSEKHKLYSAIFSIPQKRDEFSTTVQMIIDGLRDLIISKYSEVHTLLFYNDKAEAEAHAIRVGNARLLRFYDAFTHTNECISQNGNITAILAELAANCLRI